ncbi:MAG: arylsulfatase A [Kiritimatiellia bacterium]|jgi:arylsulfatase A
MNRPFLYLAICLVSLWSALAADKPNILLIMADDIGIEGFGCYGGTSYKTPNIDALAKTGLRFTHAYSQPLCTPTRVELMTGKYNQRNWMFFGILDPKEKTFGHLMQDAGYATCIAGKWQLQSYDPPDFPGAEKRRGKGMHPRDAGFDAYSLYHAEHTEDKGSRYADPTVLHNGKLHTLKGMYGPDLSVEFISHFMKQHREEPMFIYYPMALPHWPMTPTPNSKAWADPSRRLEESVEHFPDMVAYMDLLVGQLVDELELLGLRENTLILFYSDNGTDKRITSQMGELAVPGGKNQVKQSGIRVPLIANWPGKVAPGINTDLVDASDFLPTLAELGGANIPADWKTDGISLAPRLFGKPGTPREWTFFWYDPRPGWDKEPFTRHIFALDRNYKLFSDGRMFSIDGNLPTEQALELSQLTPEAEVSRDRLRKVIDQMMQPPLSDAARMDPVEFGKP